MSVNENAFLSPELYLYLAVADSNYFALSKLRMSYPVSLAESITRGILPRRSPWNRSDCFRLSGDAPCCLFRSLPAEVVPPATGATDNYGGRAVLIQGNYLMRAFAFASPAVSRHLISHSVFPYPKARAHE